MSRLFNSRFWLVAPRLAGSDLGLEPASRLKDRSNQIDFSTVPTTTEKVLPISPVDRLFEKLYK